MIRVIHTQPEHFSELVEHQKICFPTVSQADLFGVEHFLVQTQVFPEGQFVAVDDNQLVVGQSSSFRIKAEQVFCAHTFHDIVGAGYFTLHDPEGEWLYGADMSVHPDYRGQGVARKLYDARKELIRSLGMRGMVAGGMLPGYANYRHQMPVDEYVAAVVAGKLIDPTLTAQLRNGFTVQGVLYDHIEAGELGPHAALIVWEA